MNDGINVQYNAGGFTLYAMADSGYLLQRMYVGYTVPEAKVLFREELKEG